MRFYTKILAALVVASAAIPAFSYPPAPGLTIHGTVRGNLGWAIDDGVSELVFSRTGLEIGRVKIDSNRRFGENYRIVLPVDLNSGRGSYRNTALAFDDPSVLFTVHVERNGSRFFAIEALAGEVDLDAGAGEVLQLDLTLGADSDSDTLPDEWEYWQLQAAGLQPGDDGYTLDAFAPDEDIDGDGLSNYQEYIAGTFAFLATDAINLKIEKIGTDGWAHLSLLSVADKAYTIEGSPDFKTWESVPVALSDVRTDIRRAWVADGTFTQPFTTDAGTNGFRFFRARVR